MALFHKHRQATKLSMNSQWKELLNLQKMTEANFRRSN